MRLEDKLNLALKNKYLVPDVSIPSPNIEILPIEENLEQIESSVQNTTLDDLNKREVIYEFLDHAIENVRDHEEDEFGIITMMVKHMGQNISLPVKIGNYIIDDAQKTMEGHYEVHIIRDQK